MDSRKKALAHFRKELRAGRAESPIEKVSVMADSPEGLKKGLEKAEEIVENPKKALSGMMPEMEDQMESESEESESEESEENGEDSDYIKSECSDDKLASMSREELVEKVKMLRDMV